jgi:hypothetical protein
LTRAGRGWRAASASGVPAGLLADSHLDEVGLGKWFEGQIFYV